MICQKKKKEKKKVKSHTGKWKDVCIELSMQKWWNFSLDYCDLTKAKEI